MTDDDGDDDDDDDSAARSVASAADPVSAARSARTPSAVDATSDATSSRRH